MAKDKKPEEKQPVYLVDPAMMDEMSKNEDDSNLLNNILGELKKFENRASKDENDKDKQNTKIKLAFDIDPTRMVTGAVAGVGVYRNKLELLPDLVLKRIAGPGGDDLVCQILLARSNHVSLFGRPRESRFDIGFDLVPKDKSKLPEDPKEMDELMSEVEKVKELIWTCGGKVRGEAESPTFSQYLKMVTRDGLLYGRLATSMIYDDSNKFWAFRAADAGTIYKTVKYREQDNSYRSQALEKLKQLYGITNRQFDEKKYLQGEYTHAQVINGKPEQLFTPDEMLVHSLYPTTNVEYGGYPLTPIDQAIHAITTHINITMHNKLYFQHGRAARGMIVVKARGITDQVLQTMRLQFQQSINSVKNSHRMPVFGIGPDDQIEWKPIDNSSRDMEFQFLSDNNARVILGAFQMSPDELPGYGHLSRGSNSQALSESSNEYKLLAARDVGIRPLLTDLQDFFNRNILVKINPKIAKYFSLAFVGLDKDNPEKESTRLQQDMSIHMSFNEVLDATEKDRIPKLMGGDVPLNGLWWQTVTPYLTMGEILENFFGRKGAAKDPRFNFYRDPLWLQWYQMQQMEVQQRIQMAMMNMQQTEPQNQTPPDQLQQDDNGDQGQEVGKSEDFVTSKNKLAELKRKYGI